MTSQKTLYIYKTTNTVNGKIYIGQRSFAGDPTQDLYLGSGKAFKLSLKKYGRKVFSKEILEISTKEAINDREIYWIASFNAMDKDIGYNLHKGGCMDVLAVSEKLKDKPKPPRSEEYCDNISKAKLGEKNGMYGKKSTRAKIVLQLNKLNDEIIAEHDNTYVAADAVEGNFSHIASCCRGSRKTHKGFRWKYKE